MSRNNFFSAYKWSVFTSLSIKSIGLISTLILVRLLDVDDFGIVAIATLVTGLFEVLSNVGTNRYILLYPDPDRKIYDRAWTLNILLRVMTISVLYLSANVISSYLSNPELVNVLKILCAIQIITAFKNIGMLRFEREFNYKPHSKVYITAKVFSVATVISTAFYFQNYYALLIGTLVAASCETIGSYVVCRYRPKLNFKFGSDMFKFSFMVMIRSILGYLRYQMDTFLIGKGYGNDGVGRFTIAREFAYLPYNEIVFPAAGPTVNSFSELKKNRNQLFDKAYQLVFLGWALLAPSAAGFYLIAQDFTGVVLGEKWLAAAPIIAILGWMGIVIHSQFIFNVLCDALGKTSLTLINDVIGILLVLSMFNLLRPDTAAMFVEYRIYVAFGSLLLIAAFARWLLGLQISRLLMAIAAPLLSSIMMIAATSPIVSLLSEIPAVMRLILTVGAGILVYSVSMLIILRIFNVLPKRQMLLALYPEKALKILRKIRLLPAS